MARRSVSLTVYRQKVEYGGFIKTSITREFIEFRDCWYYREVNGHAWVDGKVEVFLSDLPRQC